MCVRTLAGNETINPMEISAEKNNTQQLNNNVNNNNNNNRLQKAKEKYMKIHDEMIARELQVIQERRSVDKFFAPDLADDFLAASTIKYSVFVNALIRYYEAIQRSKIFKIFFYTSQPAHVIMIAAILFVTSILVPSRDKIYVTNSSRIASFIYLTSFVMHFGAQVWMTFVSGLSLYFALPRHTFGEVQRVLFPRYFTINACLSLITLLIFVKHHPIYTWDTELAIQVIGMSGAFFLELLIRLYLTPPLLQLIVQKNAIERAAGVGNEIGRHNPGPLKHCPHYLKIHNAFRRIHVCIAMGNMVTMGCTVLHLHYIASKLCVL
ncbi:PREDICTED: transmembrane protein 205 [Polistes dominula]|uniref:Transmembrane protein 205 n=1 Tax=Polistes dominula TaxID=743375 RepID=A0ABM1IXI5_POLDO|nr:PREDICTED: transmembrane protein 205 [Polistes dominula]